MSVADVALRGAHVAAALVVVLAIGWAPSTCWDCLECMGMVGSAGRISGVVGQAAVAVPVTSFQVANRTVMWWRYSWAPRR